MSSFEEIMQVIQKGAPEEMKEITFEGSDHQLPKFDCEAQCDVIQEDIVRKMDDLYCELMPEEVLEAVAEDEYQLLGSQVDESEWEGSDSDPVEELLMCFRRPFRKYYAKVAPKFLNDYSPWEIVSALDFINTEVGLEWIWNATQDDYDLILFVLLCQKFFVFLPPNERKVEARRMLEVVINAAPDQWGEHSMSFRQKLQEASVKWKRDNPKPLNTYGDVADISFGIINRWYLGVVKWVQSRYEMLRQPFSHPSDEERVQHQFAEAQAGEEGGPPKKEEENLSSGGDSSEMDPRESGEDGGEQQVEESENVDLIENRGDLKAEPGPSTKTPITDIGFSLPPSVFAQFTDRWNNIGTFTWETSSPQGAIIYKYNLPRDIIPILETNPAMLPLLQYGYWRPNITLRLQLNSTRFHQGLLIVAVKYYSELSSNSNYIPETAEQLWQLDYATLRANASNIAEIKIPYCSFMDMIPIRQGAVGSSSYYATVYIGVASQLLTGPNGCDTVTVTKQLKLSVDSAPTQFFGQISRMELTAQSALEPIVSGAKTLLGLAGEVESLYNGLGSIFKATNMDKPVDPREAAPLLQYPTVSLSAGEGPTQSRNMRLNPASCTPHKPTTIPKGQTTLDVKQICSKWGYLQTIDINKNNVYGDLLATIPVTPMNYWMTSESLPTPTAGVAGQYTYWSGPIEYKFIVVKADPHSVRLRFSIAPCNAYEDKSGKFIDIVSQVQDFEEVSEATIVVPYLGPTKMLPVTYNNRILNAGYLQVSLESQLICMSSVATSAQVIILQRAPQIQFAVPRPIFWIPKYEYIPPVVHTAMIRNGGQVQTVFIDNLIQGSNTFVTHAERFLEQSSFEKYSIPNGGDQKMKIICTFGKTTFPSVTVNEMAQFTGFYISTGMFHSRVVSVLKGKTDPEEVDLGATYKFYRWTPDEMDELQLLFDWPETAVIDDWQVEKELEAQAGLERSDPGNKHVVEITRSGNFSQTLLGESFPLRTCLRRFQRVLGGTAKNDTEGRSLYGMYFDVNYGTLTLRSENEPISNLAFCHDGFRFGKGSLNYMFYINGTQFSEEDVKIRVYHIPPGQRDLVVTQPSFENIPAVIRVENSMYGHEVIGDGYTSVPFTVPYYNFTNYLVNGYDPKVSGIASQAAYSFGTVLITMELGKGQEVHWELERSLGDDADLYCFQGWPLCENKPTIVSINEMEPLKLTTFNQQKLVQPREDAPRSLEAQCGTERCWSSVNPGSKQKATVGAFEILAVNLEAGRRRDLALKKIAKKCGQSLQAQAGGSEEIGDEDQEEIDEWLSHVADCYMTKNPLEFAPPEVLDNHLSDSDVECLTQKFGLDDHMVVQAGWLSVVRKITTLVPTCSDVFYVKTKLAKPGSGVMGWVKSAVSTFSGYLPSQLSQTLNSSLTCVSEATGGLIGVFKNIMCALFECIKSPTTLFAMVKDLQLMICASDLWVKAVALISICMSFGWLGAKGIMIGGAVVAMMYATRPQARGWMQLTAQADEDTPQEDAEERRKNITQWCCALVAGVGASFGFVAAKSFPDGIERFIKTFGTISSSWYRLLTNSCTFIMDYIVYLLGIEKADLSELAALKNNPVDLDKWSRRVLFLTQPARLQDVLGTPRLRQEVADLYEEGSRVVRVIISAKEPPKSLTAFMQLWRALNTLYQATGEIPTSISANMAPISIWISGAPGIGKSELAKHYAAEVAKHLEVTYEGDPFFVRLPRKYWDGYTNQPIVIFDDALQVSTEPVQETFVSDWFGLMTNAPFSPEFSDISEKKRFVKPKVVIVCSNQKTPVSVTGVSTVEAFNRRRDVLIEAQFSEDFRKKFEGVERCTDPRVIESKYDLSTFNHLRFSHYSNTVKPDAKADATYTLADSLKVTKLRASQLYEQRQKATKSHLEAAKALSLESIVNTRETIVSGLMDNATKEVVDGTVSSVVSTLTSVASEVSSAIEPQGDEENVTDRQKRSLNALDKVMDREIKLRQPLILKEENARWNRFRKLRIRFDDGTNMSNVTPSFYSDLMKEEFDVYPEQPGTPFKAEVEYRGGICLYDCEKARTKCFCELHHTLCQNSEGINENARNDCVLDYCAQHKTIVYLPKPINTSLGSPQPCVLGRPEKHAAGMSHVPCNATVYNRARKLAIEMASKVNTIGSHLAPIPKKRTAVERLMTKPIEGIASISAWIKQQISSMWDVIPLKYIIPLVLAVGGFWLFKMMGCFEKIKDMMGFGQKVEPKESQESTMLFPQMASSGSVNTFRAVPVHYQLKPQGSVDDTIPKIKRNMAELSVYWDDDHRTFMKGLFVQGREALFPKHLFVRPGHTMTHFMLTIRYDTENPVSIILPLDAIQLKEVKPFSDRPAFDLCVVKFLSTKVPCAKRIIGNFMNSTVLPNLSRDAILVDSRDLTSNQLKYKYSTFICTYAKQKMETYLDGFTYRGSAVRMCGSILLDARTGCIVGLHVAGQKELGYAVRLTQEDIIPLLEGESLDIEEPILKTGGTIEPQGDIVKIGQLPKELHVSQPLATKIVPSSCTGILTEPVRSPVKMEVDGEMVPGNLNLINGLEKMACPTKSWPRDTVNAVTSWRRAKILATLPVTQNVCVRDIQTAIFGDFLVEGFEPLKMQTSVGFPLCAKPGGTSKNRYTRYKLTEQGHILEGLDAEMQTLYDEELKKRKNGTVPFSPYTIFMKDERLKLGKKPRIIEGCPYQQTIIFRQYCMDFFAAYSANPIGLNHSVGINVHGPEWSALARNLLSKGENLCCGDYSGFGPGLDTDLVMRFCDNINAWYRCHQGDQTNMEEECRVRRTLFENAAFSHCVVKDTVFQTVCGSPSGNPATVQINSEVNNMMLCCAWLELFRSTQFANLNLFDELTFTTVYGDDLIFSVSEYLQELWNNETLQKKFAEFGIKYTDADKSGQIRRWCSLQDATFLKCYFIPHPTRGYGMYLAGLEKPMIEDIPNWVRRPFADLEQCSLENSVEAVELAYAHGFEYYERLDRKLRKYWAERGRMLPVREWSYLDALYFGELSGVDLPKHLDPRAYSWA